MNQTDQRRAPAQPGGGIGAFTQRHNGDSRAALPGTADNRNDRRSEDTTVTAVPEATVITPATTRPCLNVDPKTGHHRCAGELRAMLVKARRVLRDLDVTLSRQDRIGGPSISNEIKRTKKVNQPLPYSVIASEAADVLLAQTVTRWVALIHRATAGWTAPMPVDPFAWLDEKADAICRRGFHPGLLEEVAAGLANAEDALDGAKAWLECGSCETCGQRMAGKPDRGHVECRSCGAVYDVAERRVRMLADAESRQVTATEAVRLVGLLYAGNEERVHSDHLHRATVAKWYSRGDLSSGGNDVDGHPTFRFGDVLDRAFRSLGPVGLLPAPRGSDE